MAVRADRWGPVITLDLDSDFEPPLNGDKPYPYLMLTPGMAHFSDEPSDFIPLLPGGASVEDLRSYACDFARAAQNLAMMTAEDSGMWKPGYSSENEMGNLVADRSQPLPHRRDYWCSRVPLVVVVDVEPRMSGDVVWIDPSTPESFLASWNDVVLRFAGDDEIALYQFRQIMEN